MLLKSSFGSTPCVNMFKASVTMSTLPVRSPLPKSVPSTRVAPASRPSSLAATPVPRSLCVWRLMIARSGCFWCVMNHSIMSAYWFGIISSTVLGRFKMIGSAAVAPHSSSTASQTSRAKSTSVAEKLSGEYSKRIFVLGTLLTRLRTCFVPFTAMSSTPFLSRPNVIRRCAGDVEL